jgi:ATP-dependent Zn protease
MDKSGMTQSDEGRMPRDQRGAESDNQQLTLIARQMAGRWRMSDAIGLVAVLSAEGGGPVPLPGVGETSEATLLDAETLDGIDGYRAAGLPMQAGSTSG